MAATAPFAWNSLQNDHVRPPLEKRLQPARNRVLLLRAGMVVLGKQAGIEVVVSPPRKTGSPDAMTRLQRERQQEQRFAIPVTMQQKRFFAARPVPGTAPVETLMQGVAGQALKSSPDGLDPIHLRHQLKVERHRGRRRVPFCARTLIDALDDCRTDGVHESPLAFWREGRGKVPTSGLFRHTIGGAIGDDGKHPVNAGMDRGVQPRRGPAIHRMISMAGSTHRTPLRPK